MAQAARLNLRMQKELKLLLSDPPPGASFPNLDLSSSVSLTTIDALIDGPEGTVYEKGVFKIKIQIPERYPFQPPIVTFGTPIYHPNIDTGGRICLDILNLPPKGAWQPSLNISTVLTSIGLLLSEPNPDDGLMCEASKEYKYNKQVFDQKARSMTEKYAKTDASPNHDGHQFVTDSVVTEDKAQEPVKSDMHEYSVGFRKNSGVGRKLSLEPSSSHTKENDADMNNARSSVIPDQGRHQFITESSMPKDRAPELAKTDMHEYVVGSEQLPRIGRKLSLDASGSKTRESMGMNEVPLHNLGRQSQIQEPKRDSKDMSFNDIKSNVLTTVNSDHYQDNKPRAINSKKLCLSGKNLQHKVSISTKKPDVADKKAISMTLKCAKSDASSDDGVNQFLADSRTTEDKPLELVKTNMHEYAVGLKKIPGISRKLSLNASGSNTGESEMGMNEAPINTVNSQSQIQELKQDLKGTAFLHQQLDQDKKAPVFSSKKLRLSGKKLHLDSAERTNDTMPLGPQKENMLRITDAKAHSNQEVQKLTGNSRKPSLNTLGSNTKESEMEMNEAPVNTVSSQSQIQQPKQDLKGNTFLHQQLDQDKKASAFNSKKLCLSGKKLQHEVLDSTKRTNDRIPPGHQKENRLHISDAKAHSDQEVQKLTGNSRKLSLNTLGSNAKESEMGMNEATLNTVSSQSQIQRPKQDLKGSKFLHQQLDQDKKAPAFNSKKLRLSGIRTNDTMPPGPQKENVLLISEPTAHSDQEVHKESTETSCFGNPKRKKLGLTGMKPSSGFLSLAQNKENNDKVHTGSDGNTMSKKPQTNQGYKGKLGENSAISTGLKLSRKPLQSLEEKHNKNMNLRVDAETVNTSASKHDGEESDIDILEQGVFDSEGVIVLDSEDSDEERTVRSSSRRLIGRKRLLGKC